MMKNGYNEISLVVHLILFRTEINHMQSAFIFACLSQRICLLKRNSYEYLIDYVLNKKRQRLKREPTFIDIELYGMIFIFLL